MDTEIRGRVTVVLVDSRAHQPDRPVLRPGGVRSGTHVLHNRVDRSACGGCCVGRLAHDSHAEEFQGTGCRTHLPRVPAVGNRQPRVHLGLLAVIAFVPTNDGCTGPDLRLGLILMVIPIVRAAAD